MQPDENNQSFNNLPPSAQEEIKRTIDREKLTSEIEQDLKTNPKYKPFFEQYHPSSIKNFIQHYKSKKTSWVVWGDMYQSIEQKKILKYSAISDQKIWEIQQKKLFNLQCQWRAEVLQLPDIQTSHDFMYWEQFIRQCPFVPPITENEYELYNDFILSDDFEMEEDYYYQWQKYDEYKSEYNNVGSGSTMPEWYQFYDSRMGTGALLTLPDIRGEKEDFYIKLYFDNDKKQNPGKWAVKEDPDKRPSFRYYEPKVLEEFIDAFESNNIKDTYRAMQSTMDENLEHDEKLHKAIEILKQAGDIELTYAGNWQESILQSARNYEKECLHKSFTAAYNNYLNRINMGIGFDSELSDDNINHITSLVKIFKDQILKGRVLNNEPADFNF